MAIIAGDSLPASPSSGHFGQRILHQKSLEDSSPCSLVGFSVIDFAMELKMAGQSKVPEQRGHVRIKDLQSRYLQSSVDKSIIFLEKICLCYSDLKLEV